MLPEVAGELARRCRALGLDVIGVFTHAGHGYAGPEARQAAADDEVAGLTAAADSLRAEGIEPAVVSAGSTPTAMLSARGAVTEERPGTYIFGDRLQAAIAGEPLDGVALVVAATVVSHGSRGGFVLDSGAKILGKDVAPFVEGHGAVLGWDATIKRVSDHHGVVELAEGTPRPAIGETGVRGPEPCLPGRQPGRRVPGRPRRPPGRPLAGRRPGQEQLRASRAGPVAIGLASRAGRRAGRATRRPRPGSRRPG